METRCILETYGPGGGERLERNASPVVARGAKETKIGGAEEARRNDRGGTLYSAACFRGSHVRLYRVSPSPPSRRIEDMIFES